MTVNAQGLPSSKSKLAILVHEHGDLSSSKGFDSTGEVYIGEGADEHGCPNGNDTNRREGDMVGFQL